MTLRRRRHTFDIDKILASGVVPRYWSIPEVSILVRRPREVLRRECKRGLIQHIRSGRRILIPRHEVERLIQRELSARDYEYVVKVLAADVEKKSRNR